MRRLYHVSAAVVTVLFVILYVSVINVQAAPLVQDPTPTPVEEPTDVSGDSILQSLDIPYLDAWMASAHADTTAEAFIHWNEDDPAEIPSRCARCHSTPGYLDYMGEDETEFGVVDSAHITGTTVECVACHNPTASNLVSITFPSGIAIDVSNESARCMVCHQGRASTVSVLNSIEEVGLTAEPDTISEDLGFINIHYYAAAASLYGSEAQGGFQYADRLYQPKFDHVEGYNTCIDCHRPHSLELKIAVCADCHDGVASVDDLRDIRMQGSLHDYDGDGDMEEGIYFELEGLRENLRIAIDAYSADVLETPIVYHTSRYPYYFADVNGNGEADDEDERYGAWSPRLLKAAYNYQTSLKDPGAFAHNAKYHIQLLYDSIENLNEMLAEPVDLSQARRNNAGHFDATAEAFRHFTEEEGPVSANCAKCHSATGLPFFLEHGVTIAQPSSSSLSCTTCHADLQEFTLYEVPEVTFPSGATLSFSDDSNSNTCLNCHQGRESSFSVKAAVLRSGAGPDDVSEELRFLNPHYFAAGATVFGSEASGAYQYDGKEYVGRYEHVRGFDTCTECHNVHALEVQIQECADCHEFAALDDIREEDNVTDWDGDGDVTEGVAGEVATIHSALIEAIQTYATDVVGTPVAYAPVNYPYWYVDGNESGVIEPDELSRENRYGSWTPTLLRAAYNYQYIAKDPGTYTHNGPYILQILYDSLEAIGGEEAVTGMTRPTSGSLSD